MMTWRRKSASPLLRRDSGLSAWSEGGRQPVQATPEETQGLTEPDVLGYQ